MDPTSCANRPCCMGMSFRHGKKTHLTSSSSTSRDSSCSRTPLRFALPDPPLIFLASDETRFSLSPIQTENFASWQRPQDLSGIPDDSDLEGLMRPSQSCNLVQDVTTDCSVVASLSAAIDMLTGKHSVSHILCLLSSVLMILMISIGAFFHYPPI